MHIRIGSSSYTFLVYRILTSNAFINCQVYTFVKMEKPHPRRRVFIYKIERGFVSETPDSTVTLDPVANLQRAGLA